MLSSAGRLMPRSLRNRIRDYLVGEMGVVPRPLVRHPDSVLHVSLEMVVSDLRRLQPEIFLLQIGAYDGVMEDPIYPLVERYGLRGVLVEPQVDAFQRLRANYARFGQAFTLVNAAVGPTNGSMTMYRVRPGVDCPDWVPMIASFHRDVFLKHARTAPDLPSWMEAIQVPCVQIGTLFRNSDIQRVDLLQVDTEGYDAEVLRLFDIPTRLPAIVHFEHRHLTRHQVDDCLNMLIGAGYHVHVATYDTVAYRRPSPPV